MTRIFPSKKAALLFLFLLVNCGRTDDSEIKEESASRQLDLLIVVDNSLSMKEEQENLGQKLEPLLSYVKSSDWRIGVTTTDPASTCIRDVIQSNDSDPNRRFQFAIGAGIEGSGNERGILQAVQGLKAECLNNGWVRDNSSIAVLIVSDEDNCSRAGEDCQMLPWARSQFLLDYLDSIREPGVDARVYGLFWHPSMPHSACKTALNPASIYAEAVEKTSGTWGSICDPDYSSTLERISLDMSSMMSRQ